MKIMLLMAQHTGHGHMSIAQALSEQFAKMDDVELDIVDGFMFMGKQGVEGSKIYNVITRRAKFVWKAVFKATQRNDFLPDTMAILVKYRLNRYVRAKKPDLILTVHSMFVGSVIDAFEQGGIDIPVVCLQADIVNIHSSWCDPRLMLAICPTEEAYVTSLSLGMPSDKLTVIGFPTRARFCEAARNDIDVAYDPSKPLKCLLTGGGGGAGDLMEYAYAILKNTDAELTVICGTNNHLLEKLNEKYGLKYAGRLNALGFVTDMETEYAKADVAISRASPNCMFEAIVMGKPMIIIGALPGQESDNPAFTEKHGLGVICDSPYDIADAIHRLTDNGGELFKRITASAISYRDLDSAKKVAEKVRELCLSSINEKNKGI